MPRGIILRGPKTGRRCASHPASEPGEIAPLDPLGSRDHVPVGASRKHRGLGGAVYARGVGLGFLDYGQEVL